MTLELLKHAYSVYQFNREYVIKESVFDSNFVSVTKTEDEISIVAPSNRLKNFEKIENDWKVFKIKETLDFSLIGVLSKISNILANEKISIFVISTYNTDYIMIKRENIERAIKVLIENQYEIKGFV
jgi:hypothetical protein